jgi:hypothetical protein
MKVKMIGGSVLEIIKFHEIEDLMITMVEEEEEVEVLIDTVNVSHLLLGILKMSMINLAQQKLI